MESQSKPIDHKNLKYLVSSKWLILNRLDLEIILKLKWLRELFQKDKMHPKSALMDYMLSSFPELHSLIPDGETREGTSSLFFL